jgi:hypothetical protein
MKKPITDPSGFNSFGSVTEYELPLESNLYLTWVYRIPISIEPRFMNFASMSYVIG